MNIPKSIMVVCLVSLACLLSVPASGQLAIPHNVIGSGGGTSSGGGLRLSDTVGESVIGIVNQPGMVHKIGYQYVVQTFLGDSTTAVMITAFRGEYTDEGVKLDWEIGHADGLEGFNIYRFRGADKKLIRLNDSLIPVEKVYSYIDKRIRPGESYTYHLGAVDKDGEFYSQRVTVLVPYKETTLEQNYPNPFNPSTTIVFFLSDPEGVELSIFNIQGKRVRTLVSGKRSFGKHKEIWNGRNDHGSLVSSGIYYYRLKAGKHVFTKKLTLLK